MASVGYYLFLNTFVLAIMYFYVLRIMEIIDSARNPLCLLVVFFSLISIAFLYFKPPMTASIGARRFGLTLLVVFQVKNLIDNNLKDSVMLRDLQGHVAIVTGGNSGTGLAAAKHLVGMNCHVVIGCRSMEKCHAAVKDIQQVHPTKTELIRALHLDLNDLASVRSFTNNFQDHYDRLDYLINNAGLVASEGTKTRQGLEESWGAMHVGHFALTKWLLKLMTKPLDGMDYASAPAARVINIASAAYMSGNFHPSLFSDSGSGDLSGEVTDNCPTFGPFDLISCCPLSACPHTNGYARAKLSNVFHAQELQRRFDEHVNASLSHLFPKHYRRLITASLHPGSVGTNIAPMLKYSPSFTRSADDAGLVIMHAILSDHFVGGSFIDAMLNDHDLTNYRESHLPMHVAAYPATRELAFARKQMEYFSYHKLIWNMQEFIAPKSAELIDLSQSEASSLVAARLWDVTEQVIEDWEAKKAAFSTPIRQTKRKLF